MLHDVTLTVMAAIAAGGIVITFVVGRLRARRFRELTRAAETAAERQLPALLETLCTGGQEDVGYLTASVRPLPLRRHGELARLTTAFNTLQSTAVDLANGHAALMRRGIGDVFVNLARRNQALLDEQLALLDLLEAGTRDPERLARLVDLDHIATRLRRNTEELLVVAGEDVGRTRGRPVPLVDIVRAAVGEAEGYRCVRVGPMEHVEIAGAAAADLAHVLAELIDNATGSSPPDVAVEVTARQSHRGWMLSVADRGTGMTDAEVARANDVLTRPPASGARMATAVGFVVVGHLAHKHGLKVRVVGVPDGGTVALVSVPRAMVVGGVTEMPSADVMDDDDWEDAPLPTGPVTYSELLVDNDLDAILEEAFATGRGAGDGDLDDDEPDVDSEPVAAEPDAPRLQMHHFDTGLMRLLDAAEK
jgi:signal transduction histidine kinase